MRLFGIMNDIALQNIDTNKLDMLGLYELRNLGRAVGVSRPTMHSRDELIIAIKDQLKNGNMGTPRATARGRKPRESGFDMTKLVSSEPSPSYLISVLEDDDDLYRVRSGEVGTEKRTVSGFVHLLPKGGAIVIGVDLNGYSLPIKMVSTFKLYMGAFVECTAVFSETRQTYIIDEIFNVSSGANFDSLEGIRPNEQCELNNIALKRGVRALISTPKTFDRIEDIAHSVSSGFYTVALLIDETDDSARYLKTSGVDDVYLAKVNYNLKKQILSCLLCMFRAKQQVEKGKHVVLFIDSLTKLFKLFNNSAFPDGRIVPGEVALGPLTDLKTFFMSAKALAKDKSLTVMAYINSPENSVEEYVFNEFADLANIMVKK